MQLSFLQRHGFESSSTILDLGCGPMRLGSALIPLLRDGWYYGQDINPETITLVSRCSVIPVFLTRLIIHYSLLISLILVWLIGPSKLFFQIHCLATLR